MQRTLKGNTRLLVKILAIGLALFVLYTAGTLPLPDMQQRTLYLLIVLPLVFAWYPPFREKVASTKVPLWEWPIIAVGVLACANAFFKQEFFLTHAGVPGTTLDYILGGALLLLALESSRRTVGLAFPVLTACVILYGLFGEYFPGMWQHPNFSVAHILQAQYQSLAGIWGSITGLGAGIVGMFLIFGAFLSSSGAAGVFNDVAMLVAGRWRGGGAQVAIVSSGLVGMITGSSTANAAMVGTFTIPLMKKMSYPAYFAGGVEAAASTAGQYTPPVMGAGAFVMAELLGISYTSVMRGATLTAVLFYVSAAFAVYLEARRMNLPSIPREDIPPWGKALEWNRSGMLFVPLAVLLLIIFMGRSASTACFYGSVILLFLYIFRVQDLSPRAIGQRLSTLPSMLEAGGKAIAFMAPMLVCGSIVVGIVSQTGLGVKFTVVMGFLSQSGVFWALIAGAVAILILGMGIPTTAAYLLGAAVVWPGLSKLGVSPLGGNLFLFVFACLSAITPPVCGAVFVTQAIAGSPMLKTAWVAIRLSVGAFILPFLFVYHPALLLEGDIGTILIVVVTALLGIVFITAGLWGDVGIGERLAIPTRVFLAVGGFMLVHPSLQLTLYGIPLVAITLLGHFILTRRTRKRLGVPGRP